MRPALLMARCRGISCPDPIIKLRVVNPLLCLVTVGWYSDEMDS